MGFRSDLYYRLNVFPTKLPPIAAEEVALFIARFAISEPANAIVEIAGPVRAPINEFVEKYVRATDASKSVVAMDSSPAQLVLSFNPNLRLRDLVHQGTAMEWAQYLGRKEIEILIGIHI